MTYTEFKAIVKRPVTAAEYKIIEQVYAFHPCVSETEGKQQIATIYDMFGMRVIKDMLPTAQKAVELENEISKKKCVLALLKEKYDELKN